MAHMSVVCRTRVACRALSTGLEVSAVADRAGINRVKYAIRALGGSKRFASWVCNGASTGQILDVDTPSGPTLRVFFIES